MHDGIKYEKVVGELNAKIECDRNDFNNRFDDNKSNKIYDNKRKCFNKNNGDDNNKNDKLVFLF